LPDCSRITRIKKTQTRTKITLRVMSNKVLFTCPNKSNYRS
jgi:hypothetical protein